MGWAEEDNTVTASMEKGSASKTGTYDVGRVLEGATQVSWSGVGQVMIEQM